MQPLRILRVCPAPGYINEFREKHQLNDKSFAEQVKTLQAENLYLPGGWAKCMEELGFEVFDALYDDVQLATQWAKENNALDVFKQTNPLYEILMKQILSFKPDIILFWTGAFFKVDRIHRLNLRTIVDRPMLICGVWGDEVPYGETYDSYFGDVDFMFTVNNTYRDHFKAEGIRAYTTGSGFDEDIGYDETQTGKVFDVVMCGDTGYNKIDHINRYETLCKIVGAANVRVFANEPKVREFRKQRIIFALNTLALMPSFVLVGLDRVISRFGGPRGARVVKAIKFARTMKQTGVDPSSIFGTSRNPRENYFVNKKSLKMLFPDKVEKGPLESSKYLELLAKSRIVLNVHRDEPADYGNLRCFEATGVGSLFLTDHGEAMKEFFDVGFNIERDVEAARNSNAEIVAFTDAADCVKKIDFLLKNLDVVERIGKNGKRRTRRDHTVMQRCKLMKPVLLDEFAKGTTRFEELAKSKRRTGRMHILATYDTDINPIGWDISFFVEAAEITRRMVQAETTIVNIVSPIDISRLSGVPAEYDAVVDLHGREFRIMHICGHIAHMFPNVTVNLVRDRNAQIRPFNPEFKVVPFPAEGKPHHTEYYRIVNSNPHLVRGFTASKQAIRYVQEWLSTWASPNRRLICISIREYMFDPERNSNLAEWAKFIEALDRNLYDVVVVPDSHQMATYPASPVGKYPAFWPGCFDVDLRYALYELAYLNLGVNSGPMTTSSLNKNVRYLMFKLVVPSVPHCTEEFIAWSGFQINASPAYGTELQKWVWEDDDYPVIQREFNAMIRKIEQSTMPSKVGPAPESKESASVIR